MPSQRNQQRELFQTDSAGETARQTVLWMLTDHVTVQPTFRREPHVANRARGKLLPVTSAHVVQHVGSEIETSRAVLAAEFFVRIHLYDTWFPRFLDLIEFFLLALFHVGF